MVDRKGTLPAGACICGATELRASYVQSESILRLVYSHVSVSRLGIMLPCPDNVLYRFNNYGSCSSNWGRLFRGASSC